jgi:glycerol-3-phosphate acyltransferase PlsX
MIAVDAMGGDAAPLVAVQGAYQAALKGVPVMLFGDQSSIEAILYQRDASWQKQPISIVHCSERITMGEVPTRSVTEKKDSSLVQAMQAVADDRAQAVISAGNSGAALVAAMLYLKRIPGVSRPAIGRFLPTRTGQVFCLDLGANTDTKADQLVQFAYMGHCFVSVVQNIKQPRIALLSNGHEPYKGSMAVKQAYGLLESSRLHFIGNIEPRNFFDDYADVIVSDGFVGNVMLKTMEETAKSVTMMLAQAYKKSLLGKILGFVNRSVVKRLTSYSDYNKKEGALLLGVSKPCVIAHGCSDSKAIENSILFAYETVKKDIIPSFNRKFSEYINDVAMLELRDSTHTAQT